MKNIKNIIIAFVLMDCVVALDQISKHFILQLFSIETFLPITSYLNLVLVYNHGISFGMLNGANHEWQPYLLIAVAAIICIFLIRWLLRTDSRLIAIAVGLIVGGAIGNSIDRVLHGAVVDFLDFHAFGYHWPAFNVADSAVVCGVVMLFIQSLAFDTKALQK